VLSGSCVFHVSFYACKKEMCYHSLDDPGERGGGSFVACKEHGPIIRPLFVILVIM